MPPDDQDLVHRLADGDGSLIEICVTGTSFDDWRAAVEGIVAAGYQARLLFGDVPVEPVVTPAMFSTDGDIHASLSVRVGRQDWTTNFYSEELLDFQGDPVQVTSVEDLHDIDRFMRTIMSSVGRIVRLIPESLTPGATRAYLEVTPDDPA